MSDRRPSLLSWRDRAGRPLLLCQTIRTGSLRTWYGPDGSLMDAHRVSFALRLDGFRKESLEGGGLAGLSQAQLGHTLQEELRDRGDDVLVGLQLRIGGHPAEHRLAVHLLAQVEASDRGRALQVADDLADDLSLAIGGCGSVSYGPVDSRDELASLMTELPDQGTIFRASPDHVGGDLAAPDDDGRELARLLMATPARFTALLSVSPYVDHKAVQDRVRRIARAVPAVEARADGATLRSEDGRTVSRVFSEDLVAARHTRDRLEVELPHALEIARQPARFRLTVVSSVRPPRPLLRAVARAFGGLARGGWTDLSGEQARRFASGPLEALACPVGSATPGRAALWELRPGGEVGPLLRVPRAHGTLPGIPLAPPLDRPAPMGLPCGPFDALLGTARGPGGDIDVRLTEEALARHVYLCGKTGVGKSTALEALTTDLIRGGAGVALLDPHGDLVDAVQARIPAGRRVVLFDPSSPDCPAIDPLAHDGTVEGIEAAVEALTEIMFRLYPAEYMGPMFDRQSRALLIPLAVAREPLSSIARMTSDAPFRSRCLVHLDRSNALQAEVLSFWKDEYEDWSQSFRGEMNSYTVSKYDALLKSSVLRRVCSPSGEQLDLRQILDRGDVLLARLPEGSLGPVTSWFLGLLLMGRLQRAVFARSRQRASARRSFTLILDEFQNFLGGGGYGYAKRDRTLGPLLSEARKFGMRLVLANQFLSQLDEDTRSALLGNVGSIVCFRVGARDASIVADELRGGVTAEELVDQPLFRARARVLLDGRPSEVFTLATIPPAALDLRFPGVRANDHGVPAPASGMLDAPSPRRVVRIHATVGPAKPA